MARKRKRAPGGGRKPLPSPPTVLRPAIRLYAEDADLLAWVESIPPRQLSTAIKAALRSGRASVDIARLDDVEDILDDALDSLTF